MKKLADNTTVLSNGEIDEVMMLLEALHSETGNPRVFRIIEIIMKDTIEQIRTEVSGK